MNGISRRPLGRLLPGIITAVMLATGSIGGAGAADIKPFVHAIPNDINSLDPADIKGQQDQEIGVNIYERLVEFKFEEQKDGSYLADPMAIVPQLAVSWTIDGAAITFKLRDGVKFYPTGNPMTAEDVRYSFERLVKIVGNGKNQAGIAGLFTADQIEVVDPMTVKITFKDGPNGTPTLLPVSLISMKFQQFAIIDSVEVKKHVTSEDPYANAWLIKNVASTGHYYVAGRTLGQQLELKAVANHWSGKQPAFENVVLRITGTADLVALIKGGVVDYAAEGLTGRQYDALAAAGFPVLSGDTPSLMRLWMAMDKEPFTDVRVRQAMLYAIPHERIIRTALSRRGKRAICFYNPADATCNNSFEKYSLDLEKAKQLLKDAGKENFSFDFWYTTALPYNNDIAILIADSLKSIGVTANLKPTPALQLQTAARARVLRTEDTMSGMMLNEGVIWLNDPSTATNQWLATTNNMSGAANWSRYSDPEVDELHFKFRNSSDTAARKAAYQRIQTKVSDAAVSGTPMIFLGRNIVINPAVTGVTFSQDPYARYVYLRPKG